MADLVGERRGALPAGQDRVQHYHPLVVAILPAPLPLPQVCPLDLEQFGWVVGYFPDGVRGDETSRDAARVANSTDPLFWMNESRKIYPIFAKRTASGCGRLTSEAYRIFLTADEVAAVRAAGNDARAAWLALDALKGLTP